MEIKKKLNEYKVYFVVAAIIVALISFNIYTLSQINIEKEEQIVEIEKEEKEIAKIKVDIKGQINAAGVYELDEGSRVADLINKAGGITKQGDTSLINLSKKLKDEMVVIIYSKSEVEKLKNHDEQISKTDSCPKENDACAANVLSTITETENSDVNNIYLAGFE